ncbi:hypothetical protein GCM10025734_04620 [Kitasatospora paranensis]
MGVLGQGLGGVGEELRRAEAVDQREGVSGDVHAGVGRVGGRVRGGEGVTVLDLVDGVVVSGAVGLGPSDEPHVWGGGAQDRGPGRGVAPPVGADDEVVLVAGAGGALADGGEDVGPHVHQRQHVVPVGGVGDMEFDRAGGEVEPGVGVEGVEVGPDDGTEVRWGKARRWWNWFGGPYPGLTPARTAADWRRVTSIMTSGYR